MKPEQIQSLSDDLKHALEHSINVMNERDFYLRIIKQAILSHGGELRIDSALGEQAKQETRNVEFCSGGARFISI